MSRFSDIQDLKPCFICHGHILDSKKIKRLLPTKRSTIIEWYGICNNCLDRYPEILETFERISNLPDDVEEPNHSVMFNLLESIRSHFWGNRFVPPYKPKKKE